MSRDAQMQQGLVVLRQGLLPFVHGAMREAFGSDWARRVEERWNRRLRRERGGGEPSLDALALLSIIETFWTEVFSTKLSRLDRSWVNELRAYRNQWAHQDSFDAADLPRVVDTARRLLRSIGADEAADEMVPLVAARKASVQPQAAPPPRAEPVLPRAPAEEKPRILATPRSRLVKAETNIDKVLRCLQEAAPSRLTNSDVGARSGVRPHQQVFMITQRLLAEGRIQGTKIGGAWEFWV